MKKILLFVNVALLFAGITSGASVTIVNSGFEFSPDDVTINVGDTVNFQLSAIHDAVEVSEATWNANGNSPVDGGFSTPFGGGQVTGLSAGVHFYVCTPHASGGMKGKITVNGPSGIGDNEPVVRKINIYPNPTNGIFTLQYNEPAAPAGSTPGNDQQARLEIFNLLGEKIADLPSINSQTSNKIDLSAMPDGIYFIRISDRERVYSEELIKQNMKN
jgi:plastocyanin